MGDPWKCIDQAGVPCPPLNADNQKFEDNFEDCSQDLVKNTTSLISNKSKSYEPLADSSTYLATLEKRLSKLTSKSTVHSSAERRDLLVSLSGAREGHIDRLLTLELGEQVTLDDDIDFAIEDSVTSSVIRRVAPQLQAVSAGELVHLLKADHLEKASAIEETETDISLSSTDQPTKKD